MGSERSEPGVAAWRHAYRSTMAPERAGCPGDDALAALATGDLPAEERARVADHVTRCARCADDYRLLGELHGEASALRPRPTHRVWLTAAALAAMVALAGTVFLRDDRPVGDPDRLRGAEPMRAVAPDPNAILAAPPDQLTWTAEPGARAYRVRLFDARGELVWESASEPRASRALPPEVGARLIPGGAYFWVVEVEGPGAGGASRLGPYWFQLASRG